MLSLFANIFAITATGFNEIITQLIIMEKTMFKTNLILFQNNPKNNLFNLIFYNSDENYRKHLLCAPGAYLGYVSGTFFEINS
jgi:hypothetical protein